MMVHLSLAEARALQAVRTMQVRRNENGKLEVPEDVDRRALFTLALAGYLDDQGIGPVGLTPSGAAVATPPLRPHLIASRARQMGRAA
jgi:hypothetical protein